MRLAPGADVVVVAGDTCEGCEKGFALLRRAIPAPTPIVAVAGNHEFYKSCLPDELVRARVAAAGHGITFLDDDEVVIGGVRFLGATLWTDYALDGEAWRPLAMAAARAAMNDHRRIAMSKDPWRRFRPEDALALHRASRRFLGEVLAVPFAGPTVVVTHHAPSPRSSDPRYAGSRANAAYASDLTEMVGMSDAALWLHGHTHQSCDYRVGDTRVVSNPHGYGTENGAYDPVLTLEVAR